MKQFCQTYSFSIISPSVSEKLTFYVCKLNVFLPAKMMISVLAFSVIYRNYTFLRQWPMVRQWGRQEVATRLIIQLPYLVWYVLYTLCVLLVTRCYLVLLHISIHICKYIALGNSLCSFHHELYDGIDLVHSTGFRLLLPAWDEADVTLYVSCTSRRQLNCKWNRCLLTLNFERSLYSPYVF